MQKRKKILTPKQVRFCHEYMLSGNIGSAAIQAGYHIASAHVSGSNLLRKPWVKEYMDQMRAEQREKNRPTLERILNELSLLAFADMTDYVTWGNNLRELKLMPDDKRRALSEITVTNNGNAKQVKLRIHDKMKALRLLAELFGIRGQPVQITASQTQTISVQGALTHPAPINGKADEGALPPSELHLIHDMPPVKGNDKQ